MTPQQASTIADKLLEEARKIGANRKMSDPEPKFYADGAAVTILIALSRAFTEISVPERSASDAQPFSS